MQLIVVRTDVCLPSFVEFELSISFVISHIYLLMFDSTMIQNMIKEGKIVPSEVTIKLLQRAMKESGNDKFLIDGFPRNEENRAAFENVVISNFMK